MPPDLDSQQPQDRNSQSHDCRDGMKHAGFMPGYLCPVVGHPAFHALKGGPEIRLTSIPAFLLHGELPGKFVICRCPAHACKNWPGPLSGKGLQGPAIMQPLTQGATGSSRISPADISLR